MTCVQHLGELTVRETLEFAAGCQGPGLGTSKGLPATVRAARIIQTLGLNICEDTLVGTLFFWPDTAHEALLAKGVTAPLSLTDGRCQQARHFWRPKEARHLR